MKEIKVLGASPKNLTAIKNAMSISGPTLNKGSVTADLKYTETNKLNMHPFKPFFYKISGEVFCLLSEGYIYYNSDDGQQIYRKWTPSPNSWANTFRTVKKLAIGEYTLWAKMSANGHGISFFWATKQTGEDSAWPISREYTTHSAINNDSVKTFRICDIKKEHVETIEGDISKINYIDALENAYYVTKEYIVDDIICPAFSTNYDKINIYCNWSNSINENNICLSSLDDLKAPIILTKITNLLVYEQIKNRVHYVNKTIEYIPPSGLTTTFTRYVVLKYVPRKITDEPIIEVSYTSSYVYADHNYPPYRYSGPIYDLTSGGMYTFLLALIQFLDYAYNQPRIKKYFDDNITIDSNSVIISNLDSAPSYLYTKLANCNKYLLSANYPSAVLSSLPTNIGPYDTNDTKAYITGQRYWGYSSNDHLNCERLQLIWDYKDIYFYNQDKYQILAHQTTSGWQHRPVWLDYYPIIAGDYISSKYVTSTLGDYYQRPPSGKTFGVNVSSLLNQIHIVGQGRMYVTKTAYNTWNIYNTAENDSRGETKGNTQSTINITADSPLEVNTKSNGNTTDYNISFSLKGSGLLMCNEGSILLLLPPSGRCVLISNNGKYEWVPFNNSNIK